MIFVYVVTTFASLIVCRADDETNAGSGLINPIPDGGHMVDFGDNSWGGDLWESPRYDDQEELDFLKHLSKFDIPAIDQPAADNRRPYDQIADAAEYIAFFQNMDENDIPVEDQDGDQPGITTPPRINLEGVGSVLTGPYRDLFKLLKREKAIEYWRSLAIMRRSDLLRAAMYYFKASDQEHFEKCLKSATTEIPIGENNDYREKYLSAYVMARRLKMRDEMEIVKHIVDTEFTAQNILMRASKAKVVAEPPISELSALKGPAPPRINLEEMKSYESGPYADLFKLMKRKKIYGFRASLTSSRRSNMIQATLDYIGARSSETDQQLLKDSLARTASIPLAEYNDSRERYLSAYVIFRNLNMRNEMEIVQHIVDTEYMVMPTKKRRHVESRQVESTATSGNIDRQQSQPPSDDQRPPMKKRRIVEV